MSRNSGDAPERGLLIINYVDVNIKIYTDSRNNSASNINSVHRRS